MSHLAIVPPYVSTLVGGPSAVNARRHHAKAQTQKGPRAPALDEEQRVVAALVGEKDFAAVSVAPHPSTGLHGEVHESAARDALGGVGLHEAGLRAPVTFGFVVPPDLAHSARLDFRAIARVALGDIDREAGAQA